MAPALATLAGTRGAITGASGFVGRHLLAALPAGCEVVAQYGSATDFRAFVRTVAATVEPVRVDLAREPLAAHVRGRLDWLIHCAARVPPESADDPAAVVGAIGAAAVNAVRGLDVARVVDVSTGTVYGGLEGRLGPHRPLVPTGAYGIAKLAAERLIAGAADAPVRHARVFFPFGPGEAPGRLIATLVRKAIAGDPEVHLRLDPAHRLAPLHVADLARALAGLAALPADGSAVDVCGDEALTAPDLVRRIYAVLAPGVEPAIALDPPGAGDWLPGTPSPAALDRLVGLPRLGLDEGLRRYAAALADA